MDPIWLFASLFLVLGLVSIASHRRRFFPFFTLVGGALVFGLLSGLGIDRTVGGIVDGLGHTFSAFGLIILCGAIIAKSLDVTGGIASIATDVRRYAADPYAAAGLLGYALAVPFTCCITAYVTLEPILAALGEDDTTKKTLLYLAAISSVLSYALVYPTPVIIPLVEGAGAGIDPVRYDSIAIPLSFLLVLLLVLVVRLRVRRSADRESAEKEADGPRLHLVAWVPFLVILAAVVTGLAGGVSHAALINLVMLAGAGAALCFVPPGLRDATVTNATRHAGLIIFDLTGAGALGTVIVLSGITEGALTALTGWVPIVLIPFLIAALVQSIQGSRVVTAVLVSQILGGSGVAAALDPIAFVLMVGGGACVVSYVTDPFFWLVQRTTGDEPFRVVLRYTLPLAGLGLLIFLAGVFVQIVLGGSLSL
ncbi:MAG TPA: hypothetical protein PK089_04690 [Methanoregulaceae archaeon]|nr:hypothetical protein [Methanoregulaceae archaeon]HQJ87293.1 hypothetical protein [Methanoregulaceae archaeon]